MSPPILENPVYRRFDGFYRKWASLFQVATGSLLIAVSAFLVVIAILVFSQQSNEHKQRVREEHTVRTACVRARIFGPPFIDHIERVEHRLHLGALERLVEYPPGSHKLESVLHFYRSTIPKRCP